MIHGILNVYKERGYTSNDVVGKLRGIFHQKKIGHTGTLDPEAEGVLPVCLGNATKLCGFLTDHDKDYRAVLFLGMTTDTQDFTGTVRSCIAEGYENSRLQALDTEDRKKELIERLRACGGLPKEEAVRRAAAGFEGAYDQVPPMYSALKIDGKRLYELAREGKTVERQPRRVQIFRITAEELMLPRVTLTVSCSRGTYIRTLCQDIGDALGCGGCMEALLRTRVGQFRVEDSLRLSQIGELMERGALGERILTVDEALAGFPALFTGQGADRLLYNGNPLAPEQVRRMPDPVSGMMKNAADTFGAAEAFGENCARMYDSAGKFCALYRYVPQKGRYQAMKMFLP